MTGIRYSHHLCLADVHYIIIIKPGARRPQAGRAWFLEIDPVRDVCMCVSAPEAINN